MPALLGLAPEIVLGIALLASLCAYLALRGVLSGWQHTFGLILVGSDGHGGIAGLLNYSKTLLGRHIGFDFGGPIRAANTAIVNTLELRIADAESDIAWTWHKMGQVWQAMAEATNWLAHETTATFDWLTSVHLPKWARYALLPLLLPFILPRVIKALLPHLHGSVHTVIKYVTTTLPRTIIHTVTKVVPAAIPGIIAIPGIRAEIRGLTRRWARIERRLRKLEAGVGAVAFAAVMANALGLRVKCLRSGGNVRRVLQHLCGFPKWLVDLLILGTVESFVALDLCDFTDLLITTTEGLRPGLIAFVDVENVLIGCHGNTGPSVLTLPPVSLPVTVDAVALAA